MKKYREEREKRKNFSYQIYLSTAVSQLFNRSLEYQAYPFMDNGKMAGFSLKRFHFL